MGEVPAMPDGRCRAGANLDHPGFFVSPAKERTMQTNATYPQQERRTLQPQVSATPKQLGSVPRTQNQLCAAIDQLEAAISRLLQGINTVVRPSETPQSPQEKVVPPEPCDVATQIGVSAERIGRLVNLVEDASERLEL